jgi:hypothetical protein
VSVLKYDDVRPYRRVLSADEWTPTLTDRINARPVGAPIGY